jgi:phospholipid N-methyltransferase/predicted HTH domain antitoxin
LEKEYNELRASTLNAHYTNLNIIEAIYDGLEHMGFKGGNILEPSVGTGNFFGKMPNHIQENSRLYGVELDDLTGRIAKQLYPKANIEISGFENSKTPDNFFDVAIGNVPFGNYQVHDPKYNKHGFLIHDYFFAKSIDKLRPDGVIAYITTSGTLDKANYKLRKYLAERSEFLGAIRLPNTAFKEAGTEVTTDIVFLQKRDKLTDSNKENWIYTGMYNRGEDLEPIPLNRYFIENPHMMLGELVYKQNRFGELDTALIDNGKPLKDQLKQAIQYLPSNIINEFNNLNDKDQSKYLSADPNVKNFTFAVVNDKVYYRENHIFSPINISSGKEKRLKTLINLRVLARETIDIQVYGGSDEELARVQAKLNKAYDNFKIKYGDINTPYNKSIFKNDADFALVSALEKKTDEKIEKSAIFTKRTISPYIKITSVETSAEALMLSLYEKGGVDLEYMSNLSNKSIGDIKIELKGHIFENPLTKEWETADEYLSGHVVDKLRFVKEINTINNNKYDNNIESLELLQPTPLEAHEINVSIGSSWVDIEYYKQFAIEHFGMNFYEEDNFVLDYNDLSNRWHV